MYLCANTPRFLIRKVAVARTPQHIFQPSDASSSMTRRRPKKETWFCTAYMTNEMILRTMKRTIIMMAMAMFCWTIVEVENPEV